MAPITSAERYILHLSDLHFGTETSPTNAFNQLAEDLKGSDLQCHRLDAMIISGDVANFSEAVEYEQAKQFLDELINEFKLNLSRIIMVPGNHDFNWELARDGYPLKELKAVKADLVEGQYVSISEDAVRVEDPATYPLRFQYFNDFYQLIKKEVYPVDYNHQATLHHLPELNLVIVGFNSSWRLGYYVKEPVSICPDAIANVLTTIRKNPAYAACHKFAVWHHPLNGPDEDRIKDHSFLQQLAKAGFCVCLHGHIHKAKADQYYYDVTEDGRQIRVIGAGTFGAPVKEWTPGYPLQYNLLKLSDSALTVNTRCRRELNGAWEADAIWRQGKGKDPLPRYTIELPATERPAEPEPPKKADEIPLASNASTHDHALDGDIRVYREKMASLHESLPLTGFKTKARVPLLIEEIYVPLHAALDLRVVGDACFSDAADAEEKVCRMGRSAEISIPDAFAQSSALKRRGIVILGDPGAGKTTHLKRLLLWCLRGDPQAYGLPTDILPVFLPLRELRQLDQGLDAFIEKQLEDPHLGIPAGFGKRLMARGRLLLLFDGLDEVADAGDRRLVARWISNVLKAAPSCHVAVTCRFAGYTREARLDEQFLEMHLRPLSADQAEAFIRNWYRLVQKCLMTDHHQAEISAKKQADDLVERLKAPEFRARRVFELTRNPLLLTNICLVHLDRGGKLPDRRVRLYDECTDVLLELWRHSTGVRSTIDATVGRRVLQPVAYWLHQQEGRTRASAVELAPVMEPALKAAGWTHGTAADFLETVRNQSGLLTGWDQSNYGFMHLGFQEYLAAGEVRRRSVEAPAILDELAARFGDSWWQEVILLLLGMSDPCLFTPFMHAVLRTPNFAKHIDLVTSCLDDAAEVSVEPFLGFLRAAAKKTSWEEPRLLALQLLERFAPEDLKQILPALRKDYSPIIHRWILNKNQRDAADTIKSDPSGYELVRIPGGEFMMGSPETEKGRFDREGPQHRVHVGNFYMGRYPVTNAQYGLFLNANPNIAVPEYWDDRQFNQSNQPVVGVSWEDANAYARWAGLWLPNEAHWEYTCRADTTTRYHSGDSDSDLDRVGWYRENSGRKLHAVGEKEPNAFGLHDMHGNVFEWVADDWYESYKNAPDDGSALIDNPRRPYRVIRGGSWFDSAWNCRSAFRDRGEPGDRCFYVGFRLVLLPGQSG